VKIAGDLIEIANRQTERNVLDAACGILGEVVMEHALAGNTYIQRLIDKVLVYDKLLQELWRIRHPVFQVLPT
jgi:hypothetical protein